MDEIKRYCKEMNTTMEYLAYKLGISISYLSRINSHQIKPNLETKTKLLELGINISTEDTNSANSRKNIKIQQLIEENNRLKKENKYLKEIIIIRIDKLLNKLYNKKQGDDHETR